MNLEDTFMSGIPVGIRQEAGCDIGNTEMQPNHSAKCLVVIDRASINDTVTRCKSCARGELAEEVQCLCWLARITLIRMIGPNGDSRVSLSEPSVIDQSKL